ncbi:hypothetical protein RsoM2USA_376 [Ralstonia phage RsoM2USA]|nr:hypothetical protein RsoM2USA_376 [Ralstonia phage RsoM2USA]
MATDPQITGLIIAVNNLVNILQKQSSTAGIGRHGQTYATTGVNVNRQQNSGTGTAKKSKEQIQLEATIKTAGKSLKDLTMSTDMVMEALKSMKFGLGTSAKQFKELQANANALTKSLLNTRGTTEKMQERLLKNIKDQVDASSKYTNVVDEQVSSFKKIETVLDKVGKELADYQQTLENLGSENLEQTKDTSQLRKAMRRYARRNKDAEAILKKHNISTEEGARAAAKEMDGVILARRKLKESIDNEIKRYGKEASWKIPLNETKNRLLKRHGLDRLATGSGSLSMMAEGVEKLYKDYRTYASKGFGGESIGSVQLNSSLNGMTPDQYSDLMKNNMNAVVQTGGANGFSNVLSSGRMPFLKAGLGLADAAKASANAVDTGSANLGIKASDTRAMAKFIQSYAEQFKDLRATTGFSADEFDKFNDAMLSNATIQGKLSTLGEKERIQLQSQLIEEAKKLKLTGLTNDAMAKTITTLNDLQGQSVEDRFSQGANIRAAGSMLGLNDQASRIQATMLKGKAATPEELTQMASDMAAIQKEIDRLENSGNLNDQVKADALKKMVGKQFEETGRNINVAQPGRQLTSEQALAQRDRGDVSAPMAIINGGIDMTKSVVSNPWVDTLLGAGGVIAAGGAKKYIANKFFSGGAGMSGGGGLGTSILGASKTGMGSITADVAGDAGKAALAGGAKGLGKGVLGKAIPMLGTLLGVADIGMGLYNHDGGQVGSGVGGLIGAGLGTLLGGPIGMALGGIAGSALGGVIGNMVSPSQKDVKTITNDTDDSSKPQATDQAAAQALAAQTDQLMGMNAKLSALIDLASKNLAIEQEKVDALKAARLDDPSRWAPTQANMVASWNY